MKKELYPPEPLSNKGKILYIANIILLVIMLMVNFYIYNTLPNIVPTHFGVNGKPNAYGSKSMFLIIPLAFSIGPILIMLITKYRYTLLNKYPYLINIPSFYAKIQRLPYEKRGIWINKYFEAILVLDLWLIIGFILITYGIYVGTLIHGLPSWFNYMIFGWIAIMIIGFILYLRKISRAIDLEINEILDI